MSDLIANAYLYTFVLSMTFIGMPHGAGDMAVILKNRNPVNAFFLSIIYLMIFSLGIVLWEKHSNIYFFLLWPISIFHFWDVEKQFAKRKLPVFDDIMYSSLITIPLLKLDDFEKYLTLLKGQLFFQAFENVSFILILGQVIVSVITIFKNYRNGYLFQHLFVILMTCICVIYMNLITCFYVIFISVHSLRHLHLSYLKKIINIKNYFFILLPTSVLTMVIIYFLKTSLTSVSDIEIFMIIGLGSLTLPHLIVEAYMNKRPN